jgi:hypothetical protein
MSQHFVGTGFAPGEAVVPRSSDESLPIEVFLRREVDNAQAALAETVGQLKTDVRAVADLRGWAEKYPWTTVLTAAAIGFGAAAPLKAALGGTGRATFDQRPTAGTAGAASQQPRGLLGYVDRLVAWAAELLSPFLASVAHDALQAVWSSPRASPEQRNGSPAAAKREDQPAEIDESRV